MCLSLFKDYMVYSTSEFSTDVSFDFYVDQFTARTLGYTFQKLLESGEVFTAKVGNHLCSAILFEVKVTVCQIHDRRFHVDLKILTGEEVNPRHLIVDFTPFITIKPGFSDIRRSLQTFGGPPADRYTAIAAKGLGKWAHNVSKEDRRLAKTEWLRVSYQASPQDTVATLEQRCISNIKAGL